MSIHIYSPQTFSKIYPTLNTPDTLLLSTQKMHYKPTQAKLYQAFNADAGEILQQALFEYYALNMVLDLFDTWVTLAPQSIGAFLDDYDEGVYESSQLHIVMENSALIDEWELADVITHF